jgi:hypothetical protein
MAKQNDNPNIEDQLVEDDFANFFNIYPDGNIGNNVLTYSINKSLYLLGIPKVGEKVSAPFYEYEIQQADSWTLISYKNYETIRLWWLVCKLNNIDNPTKMPKPGDKIILINKENVFDILDRIRSSE